MATAWVGILCCSTNTWLIVLLVHLLSTNAEVEILVRFSRVLIRMLTVRSFLFLLSWLMYRFGCSSSSSHQRALICVAFCIPLIISLTTSSTCVLWIQFFKITFVSDSILASIISHSVHSALNSLSHSCGTFSVFVPEPGGSATIDWVTSSATGDVKWIFCIRKLVLSSSSRTFPCIP